MYFIEHLCDMAAREGHQDYVRMMQRDILRVVDAVAPEDGSGAANVKVVRKVLTLRALRYLEDTNTDDRFFKAFSRRTFCLLKPSLKSKNVLRNAILSPTTSD